MSLPSRVIFRAGMLFLLVEMAFPVFSQSAISIVPKPLESGFVKIDSVRKIDVIVIHSSYCPTQTDSFNLECILSLYKKYDVSAHYIIDREGSIYMLVEEKNIAHHAGKGLLPDKDNRPNSRSIGIELINTVASDYTEEQYRSLVELVKQMKNRYPIKYVLGHNEVAPERKTDPWRFDWVKFNEMLERW